MANNHLYSDIDSRLDTLLPPDINKYNHWRTLQVAKAEYDNMRIEQGIKFELDAFSQWLEDEYGVQIERVDGNIGQNFEVVDEQKYLIYKLKFS
jgi:hypothetical protein